jgi:uncharacterized protein YukE
VVNVEDLKKLLADKQTELKDLKRQHMDMEYEKGEFEVGISNAYWKKFHPMSDDEFQKYVDDLKKQDADLTAEYKRVLEDYDRYHARPKRGTPEREEWDKWLEEVKVKYGIDDGGKLFDVQDDIYNRRSVVREKAKNADKFAKWKSRFAGKSEQYFVDELAKLDDAKKAVQDEIDDLKKQIEDALKVQAEAAYNAKELSKIREEIIQKHETILKTDDHKKELSDILDGMDKERANLYEKMSVNFTPSQYYKKGAGWYSPSYQKVEMDMDSHPWDDILERNLTGAWKTKFHEEMHQLDHVLANRKSKFAVMDSDSRKHAFWAFTHPETVTGKKLIQAIDDDVLDIINNAVDWDIATNGVKAKRIKSLGRIPREAKDATIRYLKTHYPTPKDRALIDTVTDAIGLTTNGNLHPYSHGFWGHSQKYCKDTGKKGATSEAWANLGAFFIRNDTEALDAVQKLMPNTVSSYKEVFDEVIEYAKTNPLDYMP